MLKYLSPIALIACACADQTPVDVADHVAAPLRSEVDRRAEVEEFVRMRHERFGVIATIKMPNGDVIDWVDGDNYPGGKSKSVPAPPEQLVDRTPGTRPPPGVAEQVRSILDDRPDLRGPEGTVPLVRPTFSRYVDGSSGKATLAEYLKSMPLGVPTPGSERLWAGREINLLSSGSQAVINAGWVTSGTDLPASDNFSIYQMNVYNRGAAGGGDDEWAGVALGRNPFLHDTTFRADFEYLTDGTDTTGDFAGGWAGFVSGYVVQSGTAFPPGVEITNLSAVNGSQFEVRVVIQLDPLCPISSSCTGAWWVWIRDQWVGYFPIGNGTNLINFDMIHNRCAGVSYYGEVFDSSEGTWTEANMTSGQFPNATGSSWQRSGYARNIQRRTTAGAWTIPTESSIVAEGGDDPSCYTQVLNSFADPWNRTMWFGGPGRVGTTCDPF